jgi:hypothetical protein
VFGAPVKKSIDACKLIVYQNVFLNKDVGNIIKFPTQHQHLIDAFQHLNERYLFTNQLSDFNKF